MKYAHLDTSHLLNGLKAFLPNTPLDKNALVIDAIDLLSHLICREKVYCDGAAFGKQREELDSVLVQVGKTLTSDALRVLQKKLNQVRFDSNDELPLILAAIRRTSSNAARLRDEVPKLSEQLKLCSAIPSSEDFTAAVQNVLLPALRGKKSLSQVDAILDDRKLAGRRFIWAALKDQESRKDLREAATGLRNVVPLFQFLFAQFRAEFAIERNKQMVEKFALKSGEIFYGPTASRSSILGIALQSKHVSPLKEQKRVEEGFQSAWFKRVDDTSGAHPHLPFALQFALNKAGTGVKTRADFLSMVLEHSQSKQVKQLRRALDSLTTCYIGHHDRAKFLEELREDVCLVQRYKEKPLPLGSKEECYLFLALAPLFLPDILSGAVGAAGGIAAYGHWRFRKTRVNAARVSEILPLELNEQEFSSRFRSIFGRNLPTG
jgi:hypothetical protein